VPEDGPGVEKLLREEGVTGLYFCLFLLHVCFFLLSSLHCHPTKKELLVPFFVTCSLHNRDVRGRDARPAQGAARGRARQDGKDGKKKTERAKLVDKKKGSAEKTV
jgi:hypothetical protein